jgi:hypothetical protein
MTITVLVDGVPVYCETAADAVAVAREAAAVGATVGPAAPGLKNGTNEKGAVIGSRWTEQRVKDFYRAIKAQQRKLLDTLLEATDGQTDAQLCQVLGLADGRSLAGVFTGLFKNAKKVGADPTKELYLRDNVIIGDRRQFEYTLADSFKAAARKWKP